MERESPMLTTDQLLDRLSDIVQALERSGKGIALLGVGSTGLETDRLDRFSDLDFLAVVEEGSKQEFIDSLDWLEAAHPIAYAFQNTVDGYKVLFADGVFAEFGVLMPSELAQIPYPPTRIVWKTDAFDEKLAQGNQLPRSDGKRSLKWLLGEILTNLFIGLGRYRRGEKLAALELVQVHAINRMMELAPYIEPAQSAQRDPFAPARRFEAHFPGLAAHLPEFMQGYERTPESARAILAFVSEHFDVNPAMRQAILALLD
jgi:hypothetical protein